MPHTRPTEVHHAFYAFALARERRVPAPKPSVRTSVRPNLFPLSCAGVEAA